MAGSKADAPLSRDFNNLYFRERLYKVASNVKLMYQTITELLILKSLCFQYLNTNSMIISFWRDLEEQWLYLQDFNIFSPSSGMPDQTEITIDGDGSSQNL